MSKECVSLEAVLGCLCNSKCLEEMRWCDDGDCPPVQRIKKLPKYTLDKETTSGTGE